MTTAIITARMQSSRIPQKVMQPICGIPILGWCIDRLRMCKNQIEIVVATTQDDSDDSLSRYCRGKGVTCWRGQTEDVLGRMAGVVGWTYEKKVLRITADLPFLSYEGVDALIDGLHPQDDYLNNIDGKQPWLDGTNCEIMWRESLLRAERLTPHIHQYRQHCTEWMREHPYDFKLRFIDSDIDTSDIAHLPLMVDKPFNLKIARFLGEKIMAAGDHSYPFLVKLVRENKQKIEAMWCE